MAAKTTAIKRGQQIDVVPESAKLQITQLTGYKHFYTLVNLEGEKKPFVEVTTSGGPRDLLYVPLDYIPSLVQELQNVHRFFMDKKGRSL